VLYRAKLVYPALKTWLLALSSERSVHHWRPELLLQEWPDGAERAAADPVMAWKVQNLKTLLERETN